jgi:hypothetical protein
MSMYMYMSGWGGMDDIVMDGSERLMMFLGR